MTSLVTVIVVVDKNKRGEASTSVLKKEVEGGETSMSVLHRFAFSFSFGIVLHLYQCRTRKS